MEVTILFWLQAWCMKKKAREQAKEGGILDPKLIIPAFARMEHRAYKPGTLLG